MVRAACFALVSLLAVSAAAWAQGGKKSGASLADALRLTPSQPSVDYSKPTAAEAAKCTINVRREGNKVGWVVEDPNGLTLRVFLDTNGDDVVDQWSYYKDGVEVYRDIDSDFNGKIDQCRWFNTGGSRWGTIRNEDGRIDSWKNISAEEVSAEVVAALAERNAARFSLVALKPDELRSLGLGKAMTDKLSERISSLAAGFRDLAASQQAIGSDAKWVQFSGGRPGSVPAGSGGSTRDVRVYENVLAIVEQGGKHTQVAIGTLVQVGDGWRVVHVPQVGDNVADAQGQGLFFQAAAPARIETATGAGGITEEVQKLLTDLEKLDRQFGAATGAQQVDYTMKRADLLERIGAATKGADRAMWLRQMADMLSAFVQSTGNAEGVKRLAAGSEKMAKDGDRDLAAYFKFRLMTAEYGLALQNSKNFTEVQARWLKDLEQYVSDYPKSPDAAEAMLQLAIAQEFAAQEDKAKAWYARILSEFPQASAAQKAAGAQTRLDSLGKTIKLSGRSPQGGVVDLAKYRGKVVLIQYWATWSEPARQDMNVIRDLLKKHGTSLGVIGVSLDTDAREVATFLGKEKLPWATIHEEGGLDSAPANQLGILTLPTMILVDQQGKVVNRNVQSSELEAEVKKLMR